MLEEVSVKTSIKNSQISASLFFPTNYINSQSGQCLQHSGHYPCAYFILIIYIQVLPQLYKPSTLIIPICRRGNCVQINSSVQGHSLTVCKWQMQGLHPGALPFRLCPQPLQQSALHSFNKFISPSVPGRNDILGCTKSWVSILGSMQWNDMLKIILFQTFLKIIINWHKNHSL